MSTITIAVSLKIKEILRHFGEKGASYNNVIRDIIKEAGWKRLDKQWNQILETDEFISLDEL